MQNPRDLLIASFGFVLLGTGLAGLLHLSLILTNMVIGFVLVNTRKQALVRQVGEQMLSVMPLLFVLFFTLAGAHLRLEEVPHLGLLGFVYIVGRSGGLIVGARLGSLFGRVAEVVRKYVGLGILSQAGVAIGLSLIIKHEFAAIGTPHAAAIGAKVITTITATCIVFEIVGPILTKVALEKAEEIPRQGA